MSLPTLLCSLALASVSAQAANIQRINNADPLNLGSAWEGGTAPDADDMAVLQASAAGNNSPLLGASTAWLGITILQPIGSHNATLEINDSTESPWNLSIGSGGITNESTINHINLKTLITTTADQTWRIKAGREIRVQKGLAGSHTLTLGDSSGDYTGTISLSSASTFTGAFVIQSGTLYAGSANALNGNQITLHGGTALDVRQTRQTIGALHGAATALVSRAAAGSTELIIHTDEPLSTYAGTIANLKLTKQGSGTQVLNGTNETIRDLVIEAGTLAINGTFAHAEGAFSSTVRSGATLASAGGQLETDLTVQTGGSLGFTLSSTVSEDPQMEIDGSLTLQTGVDLRLTVTDLIEVGQRFTLLTVTGGMPSTLFASVNGIALDETQTFTLASQTFQLQYTSDSLQLQAIPEPGTLGFAVLGSLGLWWRWRRKGGRFEGVFMNFER